MSGSNEAPQSVVSCPYVKRVRSCGTVSVGGYNGRVYVDRNEINQFELV
jgi:hypothetical protein